MNLTRPKYWLQWTGLAILAIAFVALAWLQVRLNREIADATSVRMQSNLQGSVIRFREDFYRELSTIASIFQVEQTRPDRDALVRYARRYDTWRRGAAHPRIISAIYVWRRTARGETLQVFDTRANTFAAAEWPDGLDRVHQALSGGIGDPHLRLPPGRESFPDERFRDESSRPGEPFRAGSPRQAPVSLVAEDVPAIVTRLNDKDGDSWAIVVLDKTELIQQVLPELVQRYFGDATGLEYRVAIVNISDPTTVVFNSDPNVPVSVEHADAMSNMFGPLMPPAPPNAAESKGNRAADVYQHGAGNVWMPRFDSLREGPNSRGWVFVAQHRNGSLDAAVDRLHRRNLVISFGVLIVLAGAIAIMFITTQRARRLAQMQMDFVAAVSHELRTPLAVISSAAENIADGVIDNKQHLARYGRVIKGQARQLINLIEHILLFSSSQQKRAHYNMQEVPIDTVIDAAVIATAETVRAAGFRIERSADADLPHVVCDPVALSHVLQNLITNAVKYGGDSRWIGLSARRVHDVHRDEIQVSVSDRGVGIASEEIDRIFEPFYRGRAATAAQIHGTGLGLSVARTMTEAMHGRLSVTSETGVGSIFTLCLPAHADQTPTTDVARVESNVGTDNG